MKQTRWWLQSADPNSTAVSFTGSGYHSLASIATCRIVNNAKIRRMAESTQSVATYQRQFMTKLMF